MNNRKAINDLKDAIRHPHAWPGGYPVYAVLSDGEMVCHECAKKEYKNILDSTRNGSRDGWQCIGADILWEGVAYCGHCSKELESAYGEGDEL
jgi:hypothetical protein